MNGDGFDDVVVGDSYHGSSGEGRVLVCMGSASGLSTTAAWSASGSQYEGHFGASVATAGDVDGDGYEDLLVGTPVEEGGQEDEGRAYLFLGSATGLSTTPAWTAEPDVADAWFGNSVASAGDVDADGYDDVIVAAYRLTHGQSKEGRAYLYVGSPAGLSLQPAW